MGKLITGCVLLGFLGLLLLGAALPNLPGYEPTAEPGSFAVVVLLSVVIFGIPGVILVYLGIPGAILPYRGMTAVKRKKLIVAGEVGAVLLLFVIYRGWEDYKWIYPSSEEKKRREAVIQAEKEAALDAARFESRKEYLAREFDRKVEKSKQIDRKVREHEQLNRALKEWKDRNE